jgi:hypothetical protein
MAKRRLRAYQSTEPTRSYRVVHAAGGTTVELGCVDGPPAYFASLDPFIGTLLRQGADGDVLLVDEASDAVVMRRKVAPFGA